MGRLLAIRDTGPAFVAALLAAWEAGDAVLPVDPRLPVATAADLERAMRVGDDVGPDDALVIATSGTTGPPKGAVLTHAAVAAAARATSDRLRIDPGSDRWLACLPVAHAGGLSVVTRALLTDTPLTALPRFDVETVVAAAQAGCTRVSLVARALAQLPAGLFRTVLLGGDRPPPGPPPECVVTYGLTETGGGVVYDGVPLDGVEVRVDDDAAQVGFGAGEVGSVSLRGPMLLRAYRDGTDPKDSEGWLDTGDAGRWTDTGRLEVIGRRGDLIVTGGEKVWPGPVEEVLRSHPAIGDVAVVGRTDPDWGQRVVAYVESAPGHAAVPLADLRAWTKERLPVYAVPRQVEWLDALPRTALGKIARADLAP